MKTFIRELRSVKLREPILLEGFPGLGYVGKITVGYMVKQLNAKKLAELYSPFFPHHVITNSRGSARLPRAEFYFWKNPTEEKNDLILLTTDTQAQTVEGQYEVVNSFLDYAEEMGVKVIVAIGGYSSKNQGNSGVVCVSTSRGLQDRILKAGAEVSPVGNPIVGLAGVTLGLSKLRGIDATCILGETAGHMPDPAVSKNVLKIIQKFLETDIDLEPLDREIEKAIRAIKEMEDVQQKMDDFVKKSLELESRKVTYIT